MEHMIILYQGLEYSILHLGTTFSSAHCLNHNIFVVMQKASSWDLYMLLKSINLQTYQTYQTESAVNKTKHDWQYYTTRKTSYYMFLSPKCIITLGTERNDKCMLHGCVII